MNKVKIMQLAIKLTDSQNSLIKDDDILKQIENELYSHSIMPKCFDQWYKSEYVLNYSNTLSIIQLCNLHGGGSLPQHDLFNWLHDFEEGKKCKWIPNQSKYEMCFEAIRNGYEVKE